MAALRGWLALTLLVVLVSTGSEVRGQGSGVTGHRVTYPPSGAAGHEGLPVRCLSLGVPRSGAFRGFFG